ncbi:MAG: radical SAM protein [Rhizobiales bacterium]|nr:radical SAM protein [Hyphomicrobiales bacterium]
MEHLTPARTTADSENSVQADQAGPRKFTNPFVTATGEARGHVDLARLETLWINTGTLCNIECKNCYIESSPKNDRLAYISLGEVTAYLDEIEALGMGTREIGLTGGEPFMNRETIDIMTLCLERGYNLIVLTNAMRPMMRFKSRLLALRERFADQMTLRISVDHYSRMLHEDERGPRTWLPMLEGLQWLSDNGFSIDIAGRTRWGENETKLRDGFARLFAEHGIKVDAASTKQLVLFPEMAPEQSVPEITTACWGILNVDPNSIMCATSRMVVKRRGADKPSVVACTLLPYSEDFEFAATLADSAKRVQLNHPFCSKFCVLGGGSCSAKT